MSSYLKINKVPLGFKVLMISGFFILSLPTLAFARAKGYAQMKSQTDQYLFPNVDLGVSISGGLVLSGIAPLPAGKNTIDGSEVPHNGFFGISGGTGLQFFALWNRWIGIEMGYQYLSESALNTVRFTSDQIHEIQVSQSAHHLPILLKIVTDIPSNLSFVAGVDIVRLNQSKVIAMSESNQKLNLGAGIHDGYEAFRLGIGIELPLPMRWIDLRIPIRLDGLYQPLANDAQSRAALENTSNARPSLENFRYVTEWEWQGVLTLGVSWHI